MEVLAGRVLLRPADRAVTTAFYRDTLGLAVAREFPGGTVFLLGQGQLEVSGHGTGPSTTTLWLQVRDLAGVAAELAAAGVVLDREPRREPWGWLSCGCTTRTACASSSSRSHPSTRCAATRGDAVHALSSGGPRRAPPWRCEPA